MQQMIDKTYEIRLENVRYKDIVEGMKMENMGLLGKIDEIEKINKELRSLCEENEEKLKICEGK